MTLSSFVYSVQSSKSFRVKHRHVQIIGSKQQREEIQSQIISEIENDDHLEKQNLTQRSV